MLTGITTWSGTSVALRKLIIFRVAGFNRCLTFLLLGWWDVLIVPSMVDDSLLVIVDVFHGGVLSYDFIQ